MPQVRGRTLVWTEPRSYRKLEREENQPREIFVSSLSSTSLSHHAHYGLESFRRPKCVHVEEHKNGGVCSICREVLRGVAGLNNTGQAYRVGRLRSTYEYKIAALPLGHKTGGGNVRRVTQIMKGSWMGTSGLVA